MNTNSESHANDDAARLRAVLENAVDGIITIDERGLIEKANPAAEKLFGYSASEMIGQNVSMLMPAPYQSEHDGYLQNYLSTGKKQIIGIGREVEGRTKDGRTFPVYLAVSEIVFDDRRIFTGFLHDLSEIREAERKLAALNADLEQRVEQRTKQLREAQDQLLRREKLAAMGQLSGGVAHEIRNPLGVIKNSVYFMKMKQDELDEDLADCVEDIDREVETANRIVSELLDFTRDPEAFKQLASVAEIIQASLDSVKLSPEINVVIQPIAADAMVYVDRGQIQRILTNLLRNSQQAMSESGEIRIRCVTGEPTVISVHDNGVGIPENDIAKIFEPLFTTKAKGIGLGLAVSKRYAERNFGTLTVESSHGEGTIFRLSLPRSGEPSATVS